MAEELSKLWEELSLTEVEDDELKIQSDEIEGIATRGNACALGKLIVDHMVSKETIRSALMGWWNPFGSFSLTVLGENLFLIDFDDPRDKERVLKKRTWVFEGSLLLIEDFDGLTPPEKFTFDRAEFWVRMINLPLACMGRDIGRKIGMSIGEVEAVDTDAEGVGWGEFLRVKIRLDFTKPLPRGRKINIQGDPIWIRFQYEHLPRFCFHCGVIKHGKAGCPKRSEFRHQEVVAQYGSWLRAPSPPKRSEKSYGHTKKKGYAASENPEVTGRGGGDRRRADRRREGREPEMRERREADMERGAGAFNENGVKEGKRRFSGGLKEAVHARERAEKASFETGNIFSQRSELHDNSKGKNKMAVNREQLEDVLQKSPKRVNEGGSNESKKKPSLGLDGSESSPLGVQGYRGPLFSEVEKSLQRSWSAEGKNESNSSMVTWKRVECGEKKHGAESKNLQMTIGRKRNLSGEASTAGPARKGQKVGIIAEKTNGSGMAEAGSQPRRPQ
jgi:hypothetical protein